MENVAEVDQRNDGLTIPSNGLVRGVAIGDLGGAAPSPKFNLSASFQ